MRRSMMQVYVKNSLEAVEAYIKAFGGVLGDHMLNDAGTGYYHSEIDVEGQVLAVAEASEEFGLPGVAAGVTGSVMQFCFHYGEGQDEKVRRVFEVLRDGATVLMPPGDVGWSTCMTDFIDRFGVRWCLFA